MIANLLIVIKKNTETSKIKNVLTKNKKSVGMRLKKGKEQGLKKERNKMGSMMLAKVKKQDGRLQV